MAAARFKGLMKKYGKIGVIVHCSISLASFSGLYIAIKNNVDVESMIQKVGLPSPAKEDKAADVNDQERNKTASRGGALALALLINKALFPVRVPITLVVTPPLARFLARRNIFSKRV